jgi:glutamate formiminotransferase
VITQCVVNISEGRNEPLLAEWTAVLGPLLLDLHRDPDHHRSVFTLAGDVVDLNDAVRILASACVTHLDLGTHQGAHPRLGVLDVVPFVPFDPGKEPPRHLRTTVLLRDAFARWLGNTLGVPTFLYGPRSEGVNRTLPQVRAGAFVEMAPDFGPPHPHPTAGATAVGARTALVAYNVWVSSVTVARRVAPLVRGPAVRALGLAIGDKAQVSCNLIDPGLVGPAQVYESVTVLVEEAGGSVHGAELVGLIPETVLKAIPQSRWAALGLSANLTVEARLAALRS